MKITITGRKIDLTEGLKNKVTKKLSKLDKFFNEDAEAKVKLSVEKDRQTVEVTVIQKGFIFRAEETNSDMYAAIDRIIDVLERQIRKNKTKLAKKLKASAFEGYTDDVKEEKEFNIIKTKRIDIKPMSVEEAILQMNMLGHEFYIFTNSENEHTEVVYKRKDGNYAIISAN